MQVNFSERAKIALKTLGRDDQEKLNSWLDYLRDWEDNTIVKSRSVPLNVHGQSMYVFHTTTDVRILYTVDQERKIISAIDIATRDTIISSGGKMVNGSSLEPMAMTPELLQWAEQQFHDDEMIAGVEEIQRTGGLQLQDFLHELEAEVAPRE